MTFLCFYNFNDNREKSRIDERLCYQTAIVQLFDSIRKKTAAIHKSLISEIHISRDIA